MNLDCVRELVGKNVVCKVHDNAPVIVENGCGLKIDFDSIEKLMLYEKERQGRQSNVIIKKWSDIVIVIDGVAYEMSSEKFKHIVKNNIN